jgi:hypothetical protein
LARDQFWCNPNNSSLFKKKPCFVMWYISRNISCRWPLEFKTAVRYLHFMALNGSRVFLFKCNVVCFPYTKKINTSLPL